MSEIDIAKRNLMRASLALAEAKRVYDEANERLSKLEATDRRLMLDDLKHTSLEEFEF